MRIRRRRRLLAVALLGLCGLVLLTWAAFSFVNGPVDGDALDSQLVAAPPPPARALPEELAPAPEESPSLPNDLRQYGPNDAFRSVRNVPVRHRGATNLIEPKNSGDGAVAAGPRWTPTPVPSPTPLPLPTPRPTFVADGSYSNLLQPLGIAPQEKWIDVSLERQQLVAYEGRTPVFDTLISTGTASHPTVTGQFRIWLRFEAQDMDGRRLGYNYYLRNVPYVQYFYQDYALHGTFWHSNFGRPMSHGCVNLPTPAAEWLFNWAEHGTLVNVHQ